MAVLKRWRVLERSIEALNPRLSMEEYARTGMLKSHTRINGSQGKLPKLMVCNPTSAGILAVQSLSGAILLIQMWCGNTVRNLMLPMKKDFGAREESITEDTRTKRDQVLSVRLGLKQAHTNIAIHPRRNQMLA